MKSSFRTSARSRAFHKIVKILANIPVCARSKIVEMSLTDCESPDIATQRILRAIRKELDVFMAGARLSRPAAEVHELDDTRNDIEVAFAIDRILRHWHVEGETGDARRMQLHNSKPPGISKYHITHNFLLDRLPEARDGNGGKRSDSHG